MRNMPIQIRHIAENKTQPMVGTNIANSIPNPIQNARKPISLLFLKILITLSLLIILYEEAIVQQVSDQCNKCGNYKIPQDYRNEPGNQEYRKNDTQAACITPVCIPHC